MSINSFQAVVVHFPCHETLSFVLDYQYYKALRIDTSQNNKNPYTDTEEVPSTAAKQPKGIPTDNMEEQGRRGRGGRSCIDSERALHGLQNFYANDGTITITKCYNEI